MPQTPRIDGRAAARLLDRLAQAERAPWLHQEVARRMAERLPLIKQAPANWLDWWAFTGGGPAAVEAALPHARRTAVEPTAALRERSALAIRRPWWRGWMPGAAPSASVVVEPDVPAGAAQMLWANMVLHLAADPVGQMAQWQRALAVDGFLMFSTVGPDTLLELREVYRDAGWPAPHPPFVDMHDVGDQLVQQGFADPVMDQETLRLHWSTPEALLAELRGLGANLDGDRPAGLRTPRWRRRLLDALRARAGADGRITLRFELVYGHAFKAAPRPAPGAPATVSLDQVRASLAAHRRGAKDL
ncbi:MAG TPA: biotin synthase [Aquabacterium sp.]|nr:biotin synthase [Aquabacterium sp.]